MAERKVFLRLYIHPQTSAAVAVATMCIIIPRLTPLIIIPWRIEVTTVRTAAQRGETTIAAKSMGTSAGSYSRKGADGRIGMCMKYTAITEREASIARIIVFSIVVLFFMKTTPT